MLVPNCLLAEFSDLPSSAPIRRHTFSYPGLTPSDIGCFYAVHSLKDFPTDGAGSSSTAYTGRVAELLNSVKALLADVCRSPLLGVSPDELRSKLDHIFELDEAAVAASTQRSRAMADFYQWAVESQHRSISSRLRDVLLALTE